MYCPKCKAEYREGCTVCFECEVALVEKLPVEQEPAESDIELVTVFTASDPVLFDIACSKLRAAGIRCMGKGVATRDSANGLGHPYGTILGLGELQVLRKDADAARGLLEEVEECDEDD